MTPPAFGLRGFGLTGRSTGPLLDGIDWEVPDRGVTALLGPAGTGKSTLLRLLAGAAPDGWGHRGTVTCRGRAWPPESGVVAFLPQAPRGSAPVGAWQATLDAPAPIVILDEPTVGVDAEERVHLVRAVRERAAAGAVLIATHDLTFAREVADRVGLLCAGRLIAADEAASFFARPQHPLAERFLAQGNCWPASPLVPELPSHFRWIVPERLAGMGRPGLLRDAADDLAAVAGAGVSVLVSLTADPVAAAQLRAVGLEGRHFPIRDMGVPATGPTARLCAALDRRMAMGSAVAVHCHAGLGRTGTVLAAVLVWQGASPEEAVARVRAVHPGYLQTAAQEAFVRTFAAEAR